MRLKPSEMSIVAWLFTAVGGRPVQVSHAELARKVGLAKGTVKAALRNLRKKDLVWFEERGDYGVANVYGLTGWGIAAARGHLLGRGIDA